jgi:hypothetical protein
VRLLFHDLDGGGEVRNGIAKVLRCDKQALDALRECKFLAHRVDLLADNLDLSSERRSENRSANDGSRLGEQSQGLPLDGEPRLPKWKAERSGARQGEAGDSFAVKNRPRERDLQAIDAVGK